jgi:diaminohydroxyphosphoribosylaminopyrimidine deaminase/5-amino-6-(5-phosphoribosylamino)uracil reductase
VASDNETAAMRRAVDLAGYALGATSPNPPVGAGRARRRRRPVGEGFTSPPGGPHAEIHALDLAGERAAGGTLVTTLEPCHHTPAAPVRARGRSSPPGSRAWSSASPTLLPRRVAGAAALSRRGAIAVETGVEAELCARAARRG